MHGPERTAASPVDPFASGTSDTPQLGPEFQAQYDDGICSARVCLGDGSLWAGDHIRADGEGGWIHSECAEEDGLA